MGERTGWVKLNRATVSDPLLNKNPEYLALWVHLLCNAVYEPTTALLGGKTVVLKPGQLTTGRKQLAVNSRISESKVERALKAFENAHLIEQQTTNKNRLITILSWDGLQDSEQQNEQQVNNNRTTSEQQANTLEETKNIRTKENSLVSPDGSTKAKNTFEPDSFPYLAARWLADQIEERLPNCTPHSETTLQNWAADFDKCNRLDGHGWEDIDKVLQFSQSDPFWCTNILSAGKFRKQYTQLLARMGGSQ